MANASGGYRPGDVAAGQARKLIHQGHPAQPVCWLVRRALREINVRPGDGGLRRVLSEYLKEAVEAGALEALARSGPDPEELEEERKKREEERKKSGQRAVTQAIDDHLDAITDAWAARRGQDPLFVLEEGPDGAFAVAEHDRSELAAILDARGYSNVAADEEFAANARPRPGQPITVLIHVNRVVCVWHFRPLSDEEQDVIGLVKTDPRCAESARGEARRHVERTIRCSVLSLQEVRDAAEGALQAISRRKGANLGTGFPERLNDFYWKAIEEERRAEARREKEERAEARRKRRTASAAAETATPQDEHDGVRPD